MKKTINTILTVLLISLGLTEAQAQWSSKKIVGNGNIITKTITTADYAEIMAVGSMDVHLERGSEGKISVTTDENIQEYLEIESKDGVLVIKTKKNFWFKSKKGIHVTVPFQEVDGISLVGSGDIDSKDTIKADALELSLTGSGDVDLSVEAGSVDAKVTGSGDMNISGTATNFEVKVSGSGDFDGGSLMAENTEAYVSGSGDATVYAKNSLKARVNGSGDISYRGNPEKVDKKVVGSGSIDN